MIKSKASLLWLIPLVFLAVFYFYPLSSILGLSFARGDAGGQAFFQSLTQPSVRRVVGFTIWQAALSTLVTLIVGLPGAYLLGRYRFRGKTWFRAVTGIPFVMPTLVVAAGFNALLGPTGWVNALAMRWFALDVPPIQFVNTFQAIIAAHVFYNTTIVLRLVGDFWARLDPRMAQAAQMLGASRWYTLRHITFPLLMPAIAAAALLVFIFDFSSFAVVLVLGGPQYATIEVEIFYQTTSLFNLPLAASLSLIQLLCTLGLTVAYTRLSARVSRPLTQRSAVVTQHPLRTRRERWGARVIIAGTLLLLTTPLLALAARSFINLSPQRTRDGTLEQGMTLAFYQALGENPQNSAFYAPPSRAIAVSLGYAAATVTLALLLGLPTAWLLAGRATLLTKIVDPLIMLPLGTSAVTLGLGFIISLNRPPLDLRTSPLLIPIAHTLVAFPFVVRSLTPALRSIQPVLREAAAVLGASPREVVRTIDLPLVARAMLVAAVFAFTISLGEFGATALVSRPEYPTVPVAIYRFLSRPGALNYGQGLALSTILMVVTAMGMLAIERFRVGGEEF